MARIRSVHPGLFTDEGWVSCSPLARILVIGLWTEADDQGVFEWKPLQIKMRVLPADNADLAELLEEVRRAGLVMGFEIGGKKFGAIRNFRKFQRPQKPNAIHPLPEIAARYVGLSESDTGSVSDQSATAPVIAPQMEEVRVGKEETEAKNASVSPAVAVERKTGKSISIPEGFPDADALAWAKTEAAAHHCTLNVEMRAKRFRAHAEQSGRRERDWSAAWRGWVWTALEDAPGAKPEKPPPKAAVIALDPDEIERRWAQAVEV
jgi:hypothetical protein